MPTYEYACNSCGHEMETFQRMVEDAHTLCPECNNHALKRKIGIGAGIIFKGGGFYETDFKDKKGSNSDATPKPSSTAKDQTGNTSKETKKPAAKETSSSKESS